MPVDTHNDLSDIKNVQKAYRFHSFASDKIPVENLRLCAGFTYCFPQANKQRRTLEALCLKGFVEHRGVEPLTSTMRMSRATNCANAPNLVSFVTFFYIVRSGHNFDRRGLQSE